MLLTYRTWYTIIPDDKKPVVNSIIFQHGLLIKRDPEVNLTRLKAKTKEVFLHHCMMEHNCKPLDIEQTLIIIRK